MYQYTSKDYKGNWNGKKSVMQMGKDGGTELVQLDSMTPEELAKALKYKSKAKKDLGLDQMSEQELLNTLKGLKASFRQAQGEDFKVEIDHTAKLYGGAPYIHVITFIDGKKSMDWSEDPGTSTEDVWKEVLKLRGLGKEYNLPKSSKEAIKKGILKVKGKPTKAASMRHAADMIPEEVQDTVEDSVKRMKYDGYHPGAIRRKLLKMFSDSELKSVFTGKDMNKTLSVVIKNIQSPRDYLEPGQPAPAVPDLLEEHDYKTVQPDRAPDSPEEYHRIDNSDENPRRNDPEEKETQEAIKRQKAKKQQPQPQKAPEKAPPKPEAPSDESPEKVVDPDKYHKEHGKCPKGFNWNGSKCVPSGSASAGANAGVEGVVKKYKIGDSVKYGPKGRQKTYKVTKVGKGNYGGQRLTIEGPGGTIDNVDPGLDPRFGDNWKGGSLTRLPKGCISAGDKDAYRKYFEQKLKKYKVKSPAELSEKEKAKFFEEVDKGWKGESEGQCPGSRIRSRGQGRGLGKGQGKGPIGVPGSTRQAQKPKKLTPAIRNKIAKDFKKAGLDGNGRFRKPEEGYSKAVDIISKYGLELDGIPDSHRFRGDKGSVTVDLAWSNKEDPFSPTSINSMLAVSFYKLEDDKFEVLTYIT